MLQLFHKKGIVEAGCDEAGRGCLAGPVVAGAVILPPTFQNSTLNDSKKLTEKQRYQLRDVIIKESISWGLGIVSNEEIDQINILNASFLAMHRAIDELKIKPAALLIDGNRFNPYYNIQHHCIIKGDTKFLSIAAASVIAKTFRDDIMQSIGEDFPNYNWDKNKGYPTKNHRAAIAKYGVTSHHRKSFTLLKKEAK
ncbi:MAG: ribonuclease HII [Flavobacteriales bacterium]|nr:ribonuclease HII [Flavobacteriales bacterium]